MNVVWPRTIAGAGYLQGKETCQQVLQAHVLVFWTSQVKYSEWSSHNRSIQGGMWQICSKRKWNRNRPQCSFFWRGWFARLPCKWWSCFAFKIMKSVLKQWRIIFLPLHPSFRYLLQWGIQSFARRVNLLGAYYGIPVDSIAEFVQCQYLDMPLADVPALCLYLDWSCW